MTDLDRKHASRRRVVLAAIMTAPIFLLGVLIGVMVTLGIMLGIN